jgi:cell filamentation protein
MPFDPFGDFAERGYLRNRYGETNLQNVRRLENAAFEDSLPLALRYLRKHRHILYEHVLTTNRLLFGAVYSWAGTTRLVTAPTIAIGRAGFKDFAYPDEIERAVNYALRFSSENLHKQPGKAFALFAYAHPFLDTNGRTLLTVHSELMRRIGKHIRWNEIAQPDFLIALSDAIMYQSSTMDDLIAPHLYAGALRIRAQGQVIIEATGRQ